MLELVSLSPILGPGGIQPKPSDATTKTTLSKTAMVVLVIYLALFVGAIVRAFKCTQHGTPARGVHVMLAIMSPTLYLLTSYISSGFCA